MTRPLLATIDPQAMRHNLQRVRQAVGDARIWAVVKANAYGHGLAAAYEGLRGADGFAVLLVQEAQQLRQLGWRGPSCCWKVCSRRGSWKPARAWV